MTNEIKPVITPETKIGELLDNFPGLEEVLIEIAPVFSKLKNPVLRKTIAKVTSVRQAAAVGNIRLSEMVNKLRQSVGQELLVPEVQTEKAEAGHNYSGEVLPKFDNVVMQYDARRDLESGVHPVGKVMSEIHSLNEGERYLLITPFTPAPLIDKANQKGFKTESYKINEDKYETYFSK